MKTWLCWVGVVLGVAVNGWAVNYTWVGPVSPSTGDWQNVSSWSVGSGYPFDTAQRADVAFIAGNAIITNVPYSAAPDANYNSDTNSGNQYGIIDIGDDAASTVTVSLVWTTVAIGNNRRSVAGIHVRTNDSLSYSVWSGTTVDDAYNDECGRAAYTNLCQFDSGAKFTSSWLQMGGGTVIWASNVVLNVSQLYLRGLPVNLRAWPIEGATCKITMGNDANTFDMSNVRTFYGSILKISGGNAGQLKFDVPGTATLTMTNTDIFMPAGPGSWEMGENVYIGTNDTTMCKSFSYDIWYVNAGQNPRILMQTNSVLAMCGNFVFDTNANYTYDRPSSNKVYYSVGTFRFAGTNNTIRSGTRTNTVNGAELWHSADFLTGAKYTLLDNVYSDGGDLMLDGSLSNVRTLTRLGIVNTNGFNMVGFREAPPRGSSLVLQ